MVSFIFTIQLFRTSGAGYKYLVVDDCWLARERDSDKNLVEDKKRFPSGMKSLVRLVFFIISRYLIQLATNIW